MNDSSGRQGSNALAIIKRFASTRKSKYILSVIFALLGVICSLIPYYLMSCIVIKLLDGVRDWNAYVNYFILMIIMWTLRALLHSVSTGFSHAATFAVLGDIRKALCFKLTRMPLGDVKRIPSGSLKSIIVERVDSLETTFAHIVPEFTANLIAPIAVLVYIFTINWKLGIASIMTLPVAAFCMGMMTRNAGSRWSDCVEKTKNLNDTAVEYINGIEVIKAFGKTDSSYEKFEKAAHDGAYCFIDWMKATILFFTIGMAITPTTILTIIPVGGILFMHGSITAGDLITVLILSVGMLAPLITVMSYTDDMAKIEIVFGEVQRILDHKEMERPEETRQQPEGDDIVINNVRFSYEEGAEILHGVSLSIREGSVNAFVGPSGSGKSTIARLISALWDVDSGEITFGGVNIKDMSWDDYNTKIAYVSQDNYLFNRSVMDNIRMGRKGASDEDVIEAAKRCGCHDFIIGLEKGYDTIVGDAGGHLSGGERQRISIARAMLKGAPIVILDEATAYTDPESEAVIQRSIASMIKGKTLIVIAHRLSTIVDADQIIVVNDGYIDDIGTHEQLLKKNGLYNKMWVAHVSARDTVDGGDSDV